MVQGRMGGYPWPGPGSLCLHESQSIVIETSCMRTVDVYLIRLVFRSLFNQV